MPTPSKRYVLGSLTRLAPFDVEPFGFERLAMSRWATGDYVVGEVVRGSSRLARVELAAGNVPEFLRTLVPITSQATIQGQLRTATFWCTPDYVGVGTDVDWFRMPMTPTLAQQLADGSWPRDPASTRANASS